jgi:hypothetical protein
MNKLLDYTNKYILCIAKKYIDNLPVFNMQAYEKGEKEKFIGKKEEFFNVINTLKNDPYCFVNFTKTPVFSTNYTSYFGSDNKFQTPPGYYCYPIRELFFSTADFAKRYSYISIVRSNPSRTVTLSQYNNLEQDIAKLKKLYDENIVTEMLQKAIKEKKFGNNQFGILYSVIYYLSQKYGIAKFATSFVKLGYTCLYDDGFGILHSNEPRQAVILTPKTDMEIVGVYKNYNKEVPKDTDYKNYTEFEVEQNLEKIKFPEEAILKLIDKYYLNSNLIESIIHNQKITKNIVEKLLNISSYNNSIAIKYAFTLFESQINPDIFNYVFNWVLSIFPEDLELIKSLLIEHRNFISTFSKEILDKLSSFDDPVINFRCHIHQR